MSCIRGKDTRPELLIRKGLHVRGYRYRLHVKNLPGKPDLVFPKYRAVILVHGCFWHGHDCHLFKWPSTRKDFWRNKILKNRENDEKALTTLQDSNWRVLVIWECAIKGKERLYLERVIGQCSRWLESKNSFQEIKGRKLGT
jgi:DNA mismatch endonuclease (patch repair protein)